MNDPTCSQSASRCRSSSIGLFVVAMCSNAVVRLLSLFVLLSLTFGRLELSLTFGRLELEHTAHSLRRSCYFWHICSDITPKMVICDFIRADKCSLGFEMGILES